MRSLKRLLTIAAVACVAASAQAIEHRFACTDYTQGKVFIVSPKGDIEWEYPATNCNDLSVLPNGNLLFNTGRGVKEVTRDKKVVFEYNSTSEIFAAQRLPDGNTFTAECNTGRLLELNPKGEIVKEVRLLPEGTDGGHLYIRNARKLANGNYLVCHHGGQVVKEYDPTGKVVREIPAVSGPHSAERLRNSNTIIACGDQTGYAHVFEVDKAGKTVWEVSSKDLPGINLYFMTGFERLRNGNTVMTNWLGHGNFGKSPHIIEVTKDKKVVWTFADHEHMRTVSYVVIMK